MTQPISTNDVKQVLMIKELGEYVGYGFLMSIASALWRHQLTNQGLSTVGAFIPVANIDTDCETKEDLKNYDNFVSQILKPC